jgi:hypothetical protein
MAEVPSLINYQGRLKEKSGSNVNGTKNFTVRIYDAKTGGKQIYEENIGAVVIKEGAYSFGFGEAGKSVVTPTEILARTDGEKQVFNYITKHKPILGNVTISGTGLSWTDDAGSSDATKFTSTLNKNSGAASAIFLTQAPESGTEVSISYDHNSDGVMGALSRGGQAWLGITVGGETLSPRERLVTVPYALRAGVADEVINKTKQVLYRNDLIVFSNNTQSGMGPRYYKTQGKYKIRFYIPEKTKGLTLKVEFDNWNIRYVQNSWITVNPEDYKHPIRFKINNSEALLPKEEKQVDFESIQPGWAELSVFFESPAIGRQFEINANCSLVVLGY